MSPNSPPPKWPLQVNRNQFYGNPALPNGKLNPAWEAANIVRVNIPWKAVLAWDTDAVVKTIRIHRLCAQSLQRILDAIWAAAGKKQATIEAWGMHLYGGAFEFRLQRGGNTLSSHSWACAIDWDPGRNALGDTTPNFANVPAVLKAFTDEGWIWGGTWSRPDGMHWQAARTA
jgi:D-alanyl-D-alanine carboxypeptidase